MNNFDFIKSEKTADAALLIVEKGVEETMNKFNSKAKKSC